MLKDSELKVGQGVGLVKVDFSTGENKVTPVVISTPNGIDVYDGHLITGPHSAVQLAFPELEKDIKDIVKNENQKQQRYIKETQND